MALEMPSQYAGEQSSLERRRKLAEALMAQSMQPMQARDAGRFMVAPSPMEGVAKLVQALAANKMSSGVESGQAALGQKVATDRQTKLAQALQMAQGSPQPSEELGGGPAMPGNPMGAYAQLAGSGDPTLMQAGGNMMTLQGQQDARRQTQAHQAEQAELTRKAAEERAAADRASREGIAAEGRARYERDYSSRCTRQ
jgi:hypothetical protein